MKRRVRGGQKGRMGVSLRKKTVALKRVLLVVEKRKRWKENKGKEKGRAKSEARQREEKESKSFYRIMSYDV
jgi:hypothetical protein